MTLDPDVVPWNAGVRYEVALAGAAPGTTTLIDGAMRVPVAGKGLTVATIRELKVDPAFQRRVAADAAAAAVGPRVLAHRDRAAVDRHAERRC